MPNGGGGTTQVQKADPWSGQQPYLSMGFEQAAQDILGMTPVVGAPGVPGAPPNVPGSRSGIFGQLDPAMQQFLAMRRGGQRRVSPGRGGRVPPTEYEFNPPSTVPPFSPETEQALALQTQRALAGNPLLGLGQGQIASTLGGDYMYGGPGFDAYVDAVWSGVRPQVDSMFALSGRGGSPLHAEALARGFGRGMAPLYESERNRQMQAALSTPAMAAADYGDIGQLAGVGATREAKQQQYMDEAYNRLARYMGLIQGNYGGTTTTTGGAGASPLLSGLGGAMMGGQFFGPLGALGGGLLGAFL